MACTLYIYIPISLYSRDNVKAVKGDLSHFYVSNHHKTLTHNHPGKCEACEPSKCLFMVEPSKDLKERINQQCKG